MTLRSGPGPLRPVIRLAGLLLFAVVAFAATSCGKKITDVDSALSPPDYPEGVANASQLIVYPDVPVQVETWEDRGDPGIDPSDVLLSSELVYSARAGAVLGTIIDHTPASQFQVYRRQGANGFIELGDFQLQPTRKWLASQYDAFHFSDAAPYGPGLRQYIARGTVSGVVTGQSPLTNLVSLTLAAVDPSMNYRGRAVPDTTRDSTFVMQWDPVPGASGYWLTVTSYPPSFLSNDALIRFALPRPVLIERLPDNYVAFVPASTPAGGQPIKQKIGDPLPAGGQLLLEDIGTNGALYFVRIVAVDAGGQMIAYVGTNGSYAQAAVFNAAGRPVAGKYRLFPMGGVFVQPQREPPPPPELAQAMRSGPLGPSAIPSLALQNGVRIYSGADVRRVLKRR